MRLHASVSFVIKLLVFAPPFDHYKCPQTPASLVLRYQLDIHDLSIVGDAITSGTVLSYYNPGWGLGLDRIEGRMINRGVLR